MLVATLMAALEVVVMAGGGEEAEMVEAVRAAAVVMVKASLEGEREVATRAGAVVMVKAGLEVEREAAAMAALVRAPHCSHSTRGRCQLRWGSRCLQGHCT